MLISTCFVGFNGKPVASVNAGFKMAVGLVRLPGKVTPHTPMSYRRNLADAARVAIWEAAGFLGM